MDQTEKPEKFRSLYPEIDTSTLEEKLNQRLQEKYNFDSSMYNISDTRKYFREEIEHYTRKDKSLTRLNYFILTTEVVLGAGGVASGVTLSSTGFGTVVGIPIVSGTVAGVGLLMAFGHHVFNVKRRRFTRILTLAKSVLLDFEQLYTEAMLDKKIDEWEYRKLIAKYDYYKTHKNEIKSNTQITKESVYNTIKEVPDDLKNKITDIVYASIRRNNSSATKNGVIS